MIPRLPSFDGLTATEAARRLAEVGPNELHRDEGTPAWRFLLGQVTSPVVLLLLGAAVISGVLREANQGRFEGICLAEVTSPCP